MCVSGYEHRGKMPVSETYQWIVLLTGIAIAASVAVSHTGV